MNEKELIATVQDRYGAVARSGLSNDSAAVRSVARAFGYSEEDLASLPAQANMGLSCGNPIAVAGLRAGDVVVDLGCGGGLDVLLAAKRVGSAGKAIGIDMTLAMIERAWAGAAQVGVDNVEFHLAEIDQLPLPDASVDCVISNCVINLVPDKARVFREIFRILKPGGRVAISDIALKQPLPPPVASNLEAYLGCVAGAIPMSNYERMLRAAGFEAVVVLDTSADLNAYAQASSCGCGSSTCCTAPESQGLHDGLSEILQSFDANAYAVSVRVHAVKSLQTDNKQSPGGHAMKTIQVFDKPMCCSTGICGPQVDPVLPRFAADLDWLRSKGHRVERFNLAQEPAAFVKSAAVQSLLTSAGVDCLPVIVVDGKIVSKGHYPSRELLSAWTEGGLAQSLPVVQANGGCCGGSSC